MHKVFLEMAEIIAKMHTCPRAACGTILVKDNQPIASAFNGAAIGEPFCEDEGCEIENGHCVRSVHSEIRAISEAAKHGHSTKGATAYLSNRPCQGCMGALAEAGISQVYYTNDYHSAAHSEQYDSPHLNNYLKVTKYDKA